MILPRLYNVLIECCLQLIIVFSPLAYGAVQPFYIAAFEILAALMFLFWILKVHTADKSEIMYNPFAIYAVFFILYVCLQLVFSYVNSNPNPDSIIGTIYFNATKTEFIKSVAYALIFFVTLNTIKTKEQMNRIFLTIVTTGFIMSVFFLMRYFGVKAPRGLINPDHFSGYLGMVIPLSLGLIFSGAGGGSRLKSGQGFLFLFFVITMGTALFFTMSRGGMFSFIVALLLVTLLILSRQNLKRKGRILNIVVIFIVLMIGWLGATPVIERILTIKVEITPQYFCGRFPIWMGAADIIRDYPVFGTGLGTFNYIFPKYQPTSIMDKHYSHAHSDFLELLSETGIAGFSIFFLGLISFIIHAFGKFRIRHNPYVVGMSIGVFGSLASIFSHSFTDFNLHIPANAILLTILLSLLLSILNYRDSEKHSSVQKSILTAINFQLKPLATYAILVSATLFTISFIFISTGPAIADYYFRKYESRANSNPVLAIKLLKKAIAFDHKNANYHFLLGKLYFSGITESPDDYSRPQEKAQGQLYKSIFEYQKSVNLNPTNSKYHQSLAWAYGQILDISTKAVDSHLLLPRLRQKIIAEFETAISLESNNPYRHQAYAIWLSQHATKKGFVK